MTKKVSIIILNYNGFEDSIACFQSIQKISYEKYNVVIVDNASLDNSMDRLMIYMQEKGIDSVFFNTPANAMESSLPPNMKVSLIQTGFNGGYGYGNNIGIKYAIKNSADYILVLNNDTVVNPDFLEPMVEMCEKDNRIGIASGKICFYDQPDTIWFNGGRFSPCTAKIEHFNFNEKNIGQTSKEPVTFISGCMWLIPKNIFNDVGFINEEYFMYMEDLEYCYRLLDKRYKLAVSRTSEIRHKVGSSSSGNFEKFTVYHRTRNYILFSRKFINVKWCIISSIFIFIFRYFVRLCKYKKFMSIFIMFKGVMDAFWFK